MTRAKEVKGLIVDGVQPFVPMPTTVTVRVTSDEYGESLSMADDKAGIMLMIPVEAVKDMIKVVMEVEK